MEETGTEHSFGLTTKFWWPSQGSQEVTGAIVGMKVEYNYSGGVTVLQFRLSDLDLLKAEKARQHKLEDIIQRTEQLEAKIPEN